MEVCKRGRKPLENPAYKDPNYYNDYYKKNKKYEMCICSQMVLHSNRSRHLKSLKHRFFLLNQNVEKVEEEKSEEEKL